MDADKQEFLLEKAKEGVNLVLIGLMPKYDADMNPCQILASAIHCKTQPHGKIGNVATIQRPISQLCLRIDHLHREEEQETGDVCRQDRWCQD